MNRKDKDPCLLGVFRGRLLPGPWALPLPRIPERPRGRPGSGAAFGRPPLTLGPRSPAWLSPPGCGSAGTSGGARVRGPGRLFTFGRSSPRAAPARSPAAVVVSPAASSRRRCGSAFLRVEQQLSLRRRLRPGQQGGGRGLCYPGGTPGRAGRVRAQRDPGLWGGGPCPGSGGRCGAGGEAGTGLSKALILELVVPADRRIRWPARGRFAFLLHVLGIL